MLAAHHLVKAFRRRRAVDDLTFRIEPGRVTGFLGPNGAGKTTALRMLLGLRTPDSGHALVNGRAYRDLPHPLRTVGAVLDAGAVHGGRTAAAHLHCLALTNRIPRPRVAEVLDATGLADVAGKRIRTFSLGMKQRLGISAALLGDPSCLVLDEPVNGLDPEGIRWLRGFLHAMAEQGRTVLVSSHLMTEMALTADHVLVIGRGRLLADAPLADLVGRNGGTLEDAYLRLTADASDHRGTEVRRGTR
ncbi:ABC transporter ATP-binding protein [Uniformispora flossi]|uniref:ABC transporter ATP-binding protein n=1 Tax=Uniformispora flossi TaxID=3390723 RepID=UPI003C2C82C5